MSKSKDRIRDSQLQYRHQLGQNFIYDDDLLEALAVASGIGPEEDVLEIGPGAGTLTRHLSRHAHFVRSIELDERLIPLTRAYLESCPNTEIIQGDVLTADLEAITRDLRQPVSVVANIPYYITTPLILRLTEGRPEVRSLALMVQKEVAQKLVSGPGQDGWGMLAVRCRYGFDTEIVMDVPAACFTPVPKVDSAFVRMQRRDRPPVQPACEADFFRIAQAAFALRRKTMTNGLCAALHMERSEALSLMEKAGLDPRVRGETLTLEELSCLADAYTAARKEAMECRKPE